MKERFLSYSGIISRSALTALLSLSPIIEASSNFTAYKKQPDSNFFQTDNLPLPIIHRRSNQGTALAVQELSDGSFKVLGLVDISKTD